MSSSPSKAEIDRASRAAEKMAARKEDLRLLSAGASPQSLQLTNSAFPPGMFSGARIENLSAAIGR